MTCILGISGSPSPTSKTGLVVDHLLSRFSGDSLETKHIRLNKISPKALLTANRDDPDLNAAIDAVEAADGIVLATPVFKASYSGLMKCFLDVLPQFGLTEKVVLPVATGGTLAHVLAIDYALRPVVQSMGVRHTVQGIFVAEKFVSVKNDSIELDREMSPVVNKAAKEFARALSVIYMPFRSSQSNWMTNFTIDEF